jgi:hypothetical protein
MTELNLLTRRMEQGRASHTTEASHTKAKKCEIVAFGELLHLSRAWG